MIGTSRNLRQRRVRRRRGRRNRQGFTLVELLTVILIIGILAGMITGAAIVARLMVKRAVVLAEIGQLDIALTKYKNECGEYPPDFTGLNEDDDPLVDTPGEAAAKLVIDRHLKKRFPKFRGGWNAVVATLATPVASGGYGIDASRLDSASALAFWLGGLPELSTSTQPAGFHEDPTNPFKPGLPRTPSLFEFTDDVKRYTYTNAGFLRCYYFPKGIEENPYVYFRPQRAPDGQPTYWFVERNTSVAGEYVAIVRTWPPVSPSLAPVTPSQRAVPYLDTAAGWHAENSYQIISCGLDGLFGERLTVIPPAPSMVLGSLPSATGGYPYPVTTTGENFAEGDYRNLTSVFEGKLEDAQE